MSEVQKKIPQHIAIIMDGNGRWAKQKKQPRIFGHRAGARQVRNIIEKCAKLDVAALTLFAFSTENWQRPAKEVSLLMELFLGSLKRETAELNSNNIKLRIIGDTKRFSKKIQVAIKKAENLTSNNDGMALNIAANYGGRWDISQAAREVAAQVEIGNIKSDEVDENTVAKYLNLGNLPEPDLFIRTGGEHRVSNFLIWQLAYTELYFTDVFWPDFNQDELENAISFFASNERRFGKTSEQIKVGSS